MRSATLAVFIAACAFTAALHAQQYPVKPIRIIVPFPPGGPNDVVGRLVAQNVAPDLGQPVIVENRAGAGGSIGSTLVAKAAPDGYTLLSGGMGNLVLNTIIQKAPYDTLRDFAPVVVVASAPNVLVVHPSLPAKNLKSFIALARAHPGQLNYGSGGAGSTPHLSGELFNALARIRLVHVPYKGSGPAITDLLGGQIQLAFLGIPPVQPQIAAGRLRGLAVTSAQRVKSASELPTMIEAGVPGYEMSPWYGILAPAGTPPAIVSRLHAAIAKTMGTPDTLQKLTALGAEPENATPQQYGERIKADIDKWTRIIKSAGITID
jgi:tripartite-type tricarboxylate transporter receptor subunit TctC